MAYFLIGCVVGCLVGTFAIILVSAVKDESPKDGDEESEEDKE